MAENGTERDDRRCIPVRLTDIDVDTRLQAARQCGRTSTDPDEAAELLAAALWPSDRIYWVAG